MQKITECRGAIERPQEEVQNRKKNPAEPGTLRETKSSASGNDLETGLGWGNWTIRGARSAFKLKAAFRGRRTSERGWIGKGA